MDKIIRRSITNATTGEQFDLLFLASNREAADDLMVKVGAYAKKQGLHVAEAYVKLASYALNRLAALDKDKSKKEYTCTGCMGDFKSGELRRAFGGFVCKECFGELEKTRKEYADKKASEKAQKVKPAKVKPAPKVKPAKAEKPAKEPKKAKEKPAPKVLRSVIDILVEVDKRRGLDGFAKDLVACSTHEKISTTYQRYVDGLADPGDKRLIAELAAALMVQKSQEKKAPPELTKPREEVSMLPVGRPAKEDREKTPRELVEEEKARNRKAGAEKAKTTKAAKGTKPAKEGKVIAIPAEAPRMTLHEHLIKISGAMGSHELTEWVLDAKKEHPDKLEDIGMYANARIKALALLNGAMEEYLCKGCRATFHPKGEEDRNLCAKCSKKSKKKGITLSML